MVPMIDFHCDTMLGLVDGRGGPGLRRNNLSVDFEKLQMAGAIAQFFALFIDQQNAGDPLERCLRLADRFFVELDQNSDLARWTGSYEELCRNRDENKISAFLTIEEGAVLKGDVAQLRNFYRLGVRLLTLTWNYPNELGFPNCNLEYQNQGLTSFGRDVVTEMNRLGMIIDVSHLSDGGFYDVARLSTKPFAASHSNARAVTPHARNMTDAMIRVLADKGGIMGINFCQKFLGVSPISLVSDMVRHIVHIRKVGGIDIIALGSDFDGIAPDLEIRHSGEIGKLVAGLEQQGFSSSEIEKIFFGNALRFLQDTLSNTRV
jgi:membrane dipeptidase